MILYVLQRQNKFIIMLKKISKFLNFFGGLSRLAEGYEVGQLPIY